MLKTRYMKVNVTPLENRRYWIHVIAEDKNHYSLSTWQYLLFNYHEETFFGSTLDPLTIDGVEGVILNGWQLATLFAHDTFNSMIDWDWNETAELCLAVAHTIYDAMIEKEWLPDFENWEQDEFRWKLPQRVLDEFMDDFWERDGVREFITSWFNMACHDYMENNRELKATLGARLEALRSSHIPPSLLASFFDEESFQVWMGIRENPVPFTLGLKLEEPEGIDDVWTLDVFLRDKKNRDLIVDVQNESSFPAKWRPFIDTVESDIQRWMELFPWLKGDGGLTDKLTEDEAWLFLTEASETLLVLGVDILLPSWWQAMKDASLKVKAKVKGTPKYHRKSFVGLQAMLDYDWRFSMNGVDLSEEEFNQLVEEKRRLVYIRGRWIKLDPRFIHHIQELMKKADQEGLHVRDLIQQELLSGEEEAVDELEEDPRAFAKIQIELNRNFKSMIKGLKNLEELPLEEVPSSFQGELRPYQHLGMSWLLFLRRYGFGACLADDMGLGKTIQLISYLLKVKEEEQAGPALIICPTSVLGNWQKELEKFAPSLSVHLHYGSNRLKEEAFVDEVQHHDVILTSYGLTHLDFEEFERVTWSSISIDEAQSIKNAGTKQSRAVRKLNGLHHIALTGTPMENRLTELWSIFDFTNHGYLGGLTQFQKQFVLPIERDDEKGKIKGLQTLIRPFLLRRTKKDEEVALNLPDKLEQKEYCPLTAEQASLYEQLVKDTLDEIEKLTGFERKGLILQMLGRLKQLCNHPALYLKEENPTDLLARSAKLEKLREIIDSAISSSESCLIFTQYLGMGRMIQTMMKDEFGIEVPFLNGSVPKQQRDTMITSFQNREFPVFLLSLKAGGTGLNLTAANHVVHYDRWWNPAVENQATDRAYRIGQKRFVHVHKFICTGTLEEKIDEMLEKKQSLNDEIISSDNWITELSTDELRDLIYLR